MTDPSRDLLCTYFPGGWTTTAAPARAAYLKDETGALLAVFPNGDETEADARRLRTAELAPRLAYALKELYANHPAPEGPEQWASCIEAEQTLSLLFGPVDPKTGQGGG